LKHPAPAVANLTRAKVFCFFFSKKKGFLLRQNNPQPEFRHLPFTFRAQNNGMKIHPAARHIALHARRRPHHVAVLGNGAQITYATLHQDLQAVIHALHAQRLPQPATAAIGLDDMYVQLLLVFACEALGIVTGSFRPSETADAAAMIAQSDIVLAAAPPAAPHQKFLEISQSWLTAALSARLARAPKTRLAQPDQPEAIFRSSGTTGAPKRMVLTHGAMRHRLRAQRNQALGLGLTRNSRFLAIMHFAVGSTYMAAANCLRLGATFIFQTPRAEPATSTRPMEAILAGYNPTHLTVLPYQLRAIVAALPDSDTPLLPNLTVQTIGAKLPADLRQSTLKKLAGQIRENYGTNETGAIGAVDPSGQIRLFPAVEIHLTAEGELHIRTPGMVTAYLDDPETTKAMFQNGAFVPGDLAARTAPGAIKLVGRRNDVLNLGGTKLAAADLEAQLLAAAPLRDVALLQPTTGAASPPIIVCAVPHPNTPIASLAKSLAPLMPFPFSIRLLPQIPRTPEGKIRRNHLQQTLFATR
jgi:acyl-coenzyme A synthetase/AMP-(fatty) acid ligase